MEDLADHLAAAEQRVHLLQQLRACRRGRRWRSDRASCGRRTRGSRSRARRRRRVSAGPLRAVDHHDRAHRVGGVDELRERRDGAERVRHAGDREHLRALGEQRVEVREVERPSSVSGMYRSSAPVACAGELPGHDVRVVLHLGEEDLVARLRNFRPQPWATRLIDSVVPRVKTIVRGSAAPKNEATSSRAPLEELGRLLAQRVDAPVGVGVVRR